MNNLKIANDFSYLSTDDEKLIEKLWKGLRFQQRGCFHTSLYKQKLWDGYVDFFSKKTGRFLTGLLPEVLWALNQLKIEYQVEDNREFVKFTHDKIDQNFLKDCTPKGIAPVTLEDFQVDLVNKAIVNQRGIVKAPTSAGKTLILIALMKCLPKGTPTLLLSNRKGLLVQNYDELIKWGFENVGRYDGDIKEPNLITCATVQSLKHIEKVLPKFKALIVDEVHMMTGSQCVKAYKKLTGCPVRIGISATPFKYYLKKKKGNDLAGDLVHKFTVKGYFGSLFKTDTTESGHLSTEYLQERGRLSASRCTVYPIREPMIPHETYMDAVTYGIAQNWYFHQVVQRLTAILPGRTLILVERLAHGDALHQLIPNSLWIQGKDDIETRKKVVEQLQIAKGNVVAIATQGIFNAGVNVFVHNVINAAGGKAEHEIIQRIGRGLRTAEDKTMLNYYDFIFYINDYLEKHSRKRIATIKEEGHEVIMKDEIDF